MFKVYYKMSLCYLSLHSDGKFLTRIDFCKNNDNDFKTCALLDLVINELDLYFAHKLKKFSIPILLQGTEFELKVYKALMKLPYGKVASYKEIAKQIDHPKAFRAVGNANSKNPIPIIIPCHRVVSSRGIGGYNGGLKIKKFLLKNEGIDLK
ncbi:methylated-DNA--[protein]-cysteine S-methyltransferase [Campylobacter hepaticus]|uniref:Methylated-DNA--protein-cysteine methyltransferase n=1 Tax=Campylobacter hepaticus TaxID=1813019 RepID=A0A6A7JR79_9BACT|nr:methylated-DNA--[protein]-cysteine S-methyltransferase [Campylobacter hepaticus]AXP08619.1 methylated-DNA--[protein]-cysteine S-methyltransferase [Campylobacter hepaticus]MCZ0772462.1 methylated-DNA--[protein]-cysteine S-methyltransferase [Campylobacter hepaticus]MCZ0773930.1 methylated-DNA--[protein]-cysteine S-methyltransferase [Campylobacter hepaticus]MCZ0775181.1 methylated-DNA--[protein]-cysteine S-methyltransferase [Campylobacter hepaticus]MDX2323316.1 methylated-DNA--[protein]-cystei